jgi:uncharacterized BrkB/YihY/UPF0761 family membrane protein
MGSVILTICGYIVCFFVGLLAATILVYIWQGKIDLTHLLSEANGSASMSRLQLLIFSFVIAISLFILVEKRTDNTLPDVPSGVLTLLGISASTYAVGKGISYSREEGVTSERERGAARAAAKAMSDSGAAAIVTPAAAATSGATNPPDMS